MVRRNVHFNLKVNMTASAVMTIRFKKDYKKNQFKQTQAYIRYFFEMKVTFFFLSDLRVETNCCSKDQAMVRG